MIDWIDWILIGGFVALTVISALILAVVVESFKPGKDDE